MSALLVTQLICSIAMTAIIFLVQALVYPQFLAVPLDAMPHYAQDHAKRITWVVAPLMLVELISFGLLGPSFIANSHWQIAAACLALIWIITFWKMVPTHHQLQHTPSTQAIKRLIQTNWLRSIAWLLKSIVLLSLGASLMTANPIQASIYDIAINQLDGSPLQLSDYKGKALLFVNVASRCGFTSQYQGLQVLYQAKQDKGLVIIGVPSNDFKQELSDASKIQAFCSKNYGVTFPMTEKVSVRGKNQHPLYQALTQQLPKGKQKISWNFNKILVDQNGQVIAKFGSRVSPNDAKFLSQIDTVLR